MMKHLLISLMMAATAPAGALAAPATYLLDPEASKVGFSYSAQGATATGRLPVSGSKISLDVNRVAASQIVVELDASRGTAGFPFADQAMRGPQMLDADAQPKITFVSHRIVTKETGADVTGDLTIRGQTHPVTLAAAFFRQPGTEPGSLDQLAIKLTGTLDRHRWGVSGFDGLVGPDLELEIIAWINKVQ